MKINTTLCTSSIAVSVLAAILEKVDTDMPKVYMIIWRQKKIPHVYEHVAASGHINGEEIFKIIHGTKSWIL